MHYTHNQFDLLNSRCSPLNYTVLWCENHNMIHEFCEDGAAGEEVESSCHKSHFH